MGEVIFMPNGQPYKSWSGPRVQVIRETKECPRGIQKRLDRIIGVNRFGGPLYRVVWGWNRLGWVAGLVNRFDDDGNYLREEYGQYLEPKYSYFGRERLNRWMLERWFAPEEYGSRAAWEEETREIEGFLEFQALGPYPDRGDYELVEVLEDTLAQFVQLEAEIVDYLIWRCEANRGMLADKRKQLLEEEQMRQEKERVALYADVFDDAAPAFSGVPNSTQANAPSPDPMSMKVYKFKKEPVKDIGKAVAPSGRGMSQF